MEEYVVLTNKNSKSYLSYLIIEITKIHEKWIALRS